MHPIIRALIKVGDPKKAAFYPSFFKTGKGEYGEGDVFLGVTVPKQRRIAKAHRDTPLSELAALVKDRRHEVRLTALLILVDQFRQADPTKNRPGNRAIRRKLFSFYVKNLKFVNNWDLIDTTAPYILGEYLLDNPRNVLNKLARSKHLWSERAAMVATQAFIRNGQLDDTFRLAQVFFSHEHNLIHKAAGWMLRETGKKDKKRLKDFLDQHAHKMPRTMLRYAIERFDERERKKYLGLANK